MKFAWMLFLPLLVAPPALAADVVTEEPTLYGAWTAISAERDGTAASELIGHRIAFDGDRFHIRKENTVLYGGRFATNHEESPAQIDLAVEEGEAKGQDWVGIYKIENDVLTICDNAPDRSARRPREFASPKGSGHVCLSFKR
jgi:uncharacterized protein (TIGR03067 family)